MIRYFASHCSPALLVPIPKRTSACFLAIPSTFPGSLVPVFSPSLSISYLTCSLSHSDCICQTGAIVACGLLRIRGDVWEASGAAPDTWHLSSGCCNKAPQSGGLINNRNLFLTILETGGPRSRCQHAGVLVRVLFLVAEGQLLISHVGKTLWDPFVRALIPFMSIPT